MDTEKFPWGDWSPEFVTYGIIRRVMHATKVQYSPKLARFSLSISLGSLDWISSLAQATYWCHLCKGSRVVSRSPFHFPVSWRIILQRELSVLDPTRWSTCSGNQSAVSISAAAIARTIQYSSLSWVDRQWENNPRKTHVRPSDRRDNAAVFAASSQLCGGWQYWMAWRRDWVFPQSVSFINIGSFDS